MPKSPFWGQGGEILHELCFVKTTIKKYIYWAGIMTQVVEPSKPEAQSSNPSTIKKVKN
jgi:hypothetical protein